MVHPLPSKPKAPVSISRGTTVASLAAKDTISSLHGTRRRRSSSRGAARVQITLSSSKRKVVLACLHRFAVADSMNGKPRTKRFSHALARLSRNVPQEASSLDLVGANLGTTRPKKRNHLIPKVLAMSAKYVLSKRKLSTLLTKLGTRGLRKGLAKPEKVHDLVAPMLQKSKLSSSPRNKSARRGLWMLARRRVMLGRQNTNDKCMLFVAKARRYEKQYNLIVQPWSIYLPCFLKSIDIKP